MDSTGVGIWVNNKMKRREYLGCPIDRETWYTISCAECIYSAKNEEGEHDHCMNYDEWDDEDEEESGNE